MFQYSVSIFNNVDLLILVYVYMDLLALYSHPLFVILFKVVFFFFCPPVFVGFFFFLFLSCYDLWPVLKNSISFHQPLCIPQHIQFVFCHSSEKEDDLQLIINCSGILDIKGRFFFYEE